MTTFISSEAQKNMDNQQTVSVVKYKNHETFAYERHMHPTDRSTKLIIYMMLKGTGNLHK